MSLNKLSLDFSVKPSFSYSLSESTTSITINHINVGISLSVQKSHVGNVYVDWKNLLSNHTQAAKKNKDNTKNHTISLYETMICDLQEELKQLK